MFVMHIFRLYICRKLKKLHTNNEPIIISFIKKSNVKINDIELFYYQHIEEVLEDYKKNHKICDILKLIYKSYFLPLDIMLELEK